MDQVCRRLSLQQVSLDTGPKSLGHILILVVVGQQEGPRSMRGFLQLTCSIKSIQDWHTDIKNGDVWADLGNQLDGLLTVGCSGLSSPWRGTELGHLDLDEVVLDGVHDQIADGVQIELPHDVATMCFHGLGT